MSVIDLRSDLMIGASERVRGAVAQAMARPPAMRRGEDLYEQRLTEMLADQLGQEAALLLPTCTMANQIALRVWLPDGGEVAAAAASHVLTVEAAATALTGVMTHLVSAERGHPSPQTVAAFFAAREVSSRPTLVWLENTSMLGGGSLTPPGWQDGVAEVCRRSAAHLHLDGSRLWNAAAATGGTMAEVARGAHSVSLSLNKAVGAPLGAVLVGGREMIEAAAAVRAALGGEWRPIGWIAAGALAALEDWRERLVQDHVVARAIAEGLQSRLGEDQVPTPETNLVFIHVAKGGAATAAKIAAAEGVLVLPLSPVLIRLAIHSGVTEKDAERLADVLARAVEAVPNP